MLEEKVTHGTRVPFYDLQPSHVGLRTEILGAISDLVDSNQYTNGPAVEEFERAYAAFCGVAECVGVASGLDALRIALASLGIGPGDEVIVPGATFVATLEAVAQVGARIVLVDVDDSDYTLDLRQTSAAIGPRTRAVIPVHLYGQVADMRGLLGVAAAYDLSVVEDACQAHGASRGGYHAGAGGTAGAFSFYPGKNLGAFGDAGALVTDDHALAQAARALREHGQRAKYRHEVPGWTARLDTIHALVLLHKLPLLERWNRERREAAAHYADSLAGVGDLRLPAVAAESDPVWHLYVVRSERRDALARHLGTRGIATGLHYPEPPHLSQAFAHLTQPRGSLPVTEALSRECLSLPIFPGIRPAQLEAVVDAVREFFANGE